MRVRRESRQPRQATFLDDPSEYPEYATLTNTLQTLHKLRRAFHTNRTAALILTLSVCVAISGAPAPHEASFAAWTRYIWVAGHGDRLVEHFAGFGSALACMAIIAALSVVIFPILLLVDSPSKRANVEGWSRATALTVGLLVVAIWGIALWAKSRYSWGMASGLWVGLYCACNTLKVTSFAVATRRAVCQASQALATPSDGARAGDLRDSCELPEQDPPIEQTLTFDEFIFFLLVPALACETHLMKKSARRRSRPLRAASEFFHAVLAYLALHTIAGSLFAPAMRIFAGGALPSSWADAVLWAELEEAGHGGWPSWIAASAVLRPDVTSDGCSGYAAFWMTVSSFACMVVVYSTVVNFLAFYAFWHCTCLGMAELWGFPDRHLYGPWWLIYDNPRDLMRTWSLPVHRWLSSCVHWPMLRFEARRARATGRLEKPEEAVQGGASAKNKGNEAQRPRPPGWGRASTSVFVVSAVFHELVSYVGMRGTCWPFNTYLISVAGTLFLVWDTIFPLPVKQALPPKSPEPTIDMGPSPAAPPSGVIGNDAADNIRRDRRAVSPIGERGWLAAAVFMLLVQLSWIIIQYGGWLWWRTVLMKY